MIKEESIKSASHNPSPDWSNKTILVVEDEEINFFYIKEALSQTGVNLIYADNGLAALNIVQENPDIDLILLDVKMPILSGYETTRKVKKLRADLPVIAQTAYSLTGEKRKSIEAGCDGYLSKPIRPDDLFETVARYLDK